MNQIQPKYRHVHVGKLSMGPFVCFQNDFRPQAQDHVLSNREGGLHNMEGGHGQQQQQPKEGKLPNTPLPGIHPRNTPPIQRRRTRILRRSKT